MALISVGVWGWKQADDHVKYILAIGLPLAIGIIWGVFAVPDDPSRSGQSVIATSGVIRLMIELGVFLIAALVLHNQGQQKLSFVFALMVVIHYLLSFKRILWLLEN